MARPGPGLAPLAWIPGARFGEEPEERPGKRAIERPGKRAIKRAVQIGGVLGVLGGLGGLAGCGASPPVATPSDAARVHIELAELQRGRTLLVSKCSSCHRPPLPADQTVRAWPGKLGEMAERAHLDVAEQHLIEQYLVTMAAR